VDAHLTLEESRAVMDRQEQLVERYSRLIRERGEAVVLYDIPSGM
jgi:hypothetical protein